MRRWRERLIVKLGGHVRCPYNGPVEVVANISINGKLAASFLIDGRDHQARNGTLTLELPIEIAETTYP